MKMNGKWDEWKEKPDESASTTIPSDFAII